MATTNNSQSEEITHQPQQNIEEEKESREEVKIESEEQEYQNKDHRRWRAKLYQLNTDGGWNDLGTGY
jgi:hypothetical protein